MSATTTPCCRTTMRPVSVTNPIRAACRSHFANTASISRSRPRSTITSIRSWDSDSMISYEFMPLSRCGTASSSISMPAPPRLAVSHVEHVSPAAPMSWIPTTSPGTAIISRHASMSSFSMKGSPFCTAGRSDALSALSSFEANAAPPSPSRPVAAPT